MPLQIRQGKSLPNDALVSIAQLFKDDITLENISRAQVLYSPKCSTHSLCTRSCLCEARFINCTVLVYMRSSLACVGTWV